MVMNEFSPLRRYNRMENDFRFKMVVSPFVDMKIVLQSTNPYNYMKNIFSKGLKAQFPKIPNLKTDGLILTPTNTEYLRGSWAFCGNDQFKWKPNNELTVDLKLGKQVMLPVIINEREVMENVYKAYTRRGKKPIFVGYVIADTEPNSDIVECIWLNDTDNPNLFEYKNDRPDKKLPNAEMTVQSVAKAIVEPFSMKALQIVYRYGLKKLTKMSKAKKLSPQLKQVIQQLGPSFRLRCILDTNPSKIFTKTDINKLLKLVTLTKKTKGSELESRFRFPNNLPYFNCLVSKLKSPDYEQPLPVLKTYGANGLRKSEVVLGDHTVLEEHIIKKELQRLRVQSNDIMKGSGYNLQFLDTVLSTETNTRRNFKPKMYRYQVRYEVDPMPLSPLGRTPSVLWRLDITEYGESKNSWMDAKRDYEVSPKSSIEIEYAPGDQENSVWRYYEDNNSPQNLLNVVDIFDLSVNNNNPGIVKAKLDERVKKIKNATPEFIVKDYCRLVVWVLRLIYS